MPSWAVLCHTRGFLPSPLPSPRWGEGELAEGWDEGVILARWARGSWCGERRIALGVSIV